MDSVNPLEAWRRSMCLTAASAARLLKVSRKQWYDWVSGRAVPQLGKAELLLSETGVTRSALMAWKEKSAMPSRGPVGRLVT